MSSMSEKLNRQSEGWKPSVGDEIIGTVADVSERETEFGVYPLVTIEATDGRLVDVHCFHTVLKKELGRIKPKAGDEIGIKYLGKPEGRSYESYKVVLERTGPAPAIDWDRHHQAASDEIGVDEMVAADNGFFDTDDDQYDGEE